MCMSRLKQMFKFLPFVRNEEAKKSLSTPRKIFCRAHRKCGIFKRCKKLENIENTHDCSGEWGSFLLSEPQGFFCGLNNQIFEDHNLKMHPLNESEI